MEKQIEKHKETKGGTHFRSLRPFGEMEHWLDESFPRGMMNRWAWPSWGELTRPLERVSPRVNLVDRDDEIILSAEVPGVKKEDLDISLTENTLTLQGTTKHEEKEEKGDYYRHEIVSGEFSRAINLPSAVDTDRVEATFQDGMLKIKIPKVNKSKRRHIELS